MNANKTTIFFSSTCYDLKQIRQSLREFADAAEYDSILSESQTFPVNPDQNAIENCLENVKKRTDIYVLIIGNRYGSVDSSGRSITNLEYLEARAKGIPIYCFISKETDEHYRIWKTAGNGAVAALVDNVKLFEFIDSIYSKGENWVFKFEYAQDLISTLKIQLSYLFSDSLRLRQLLNGIESWKLQLDAASLRILVEKKSGWEFYLYGEQLRQKGRQVKDKRMDLDLKISIGDPIHFGSPELLRAWIQGKLSKALHLLSVFGKVFNVNKDDIFGKPGEPGDPENIIY